MERQLGIYFRFFRWTLVICGAYIGAFIGYSMSMCAALLIVVLATLGGVVFAALVGVFLCLLIDTGVISNERQARIVVFSIWGTIAVFVVVGTTLEFVAQRPMLLYSAFEVIFGLIFGAEIGAAVYTSLGQRNAKRGGDPPLF